MKKIFLYSFAFLAHSYISAQQHISFEANEGYTTGLLYGQNGWQPWSQSPLYGNLLSITNNEASEGTQSLACIKQQEQGGLFFKNVPAPSNFYDVSFDYKSIYGEVVTLSYRDVNQYGSGRLTFVVFDTGAVCFGNANSMINNSGVVMTEGVWYNLKLRINRLTNVVRFYINNVEVGSDTITDTTLYGSDFVASISADPGGFYIDNIRLTDVTNLSSDEIKATSSDVLVYPVPAKDYFLVNTSAVVTLLELYDASGKLVRTAKENRMNLQGLAKGTYFVNIITKAETYQKKIVVN